MADGDLEACYRLLLGREPDPGGFAHHRRRLESGQTTIDGIVEEFIRSGEFRRRHPGLLAERNEETVVDTGRFSIHVDAADHAIGAAIVGTGDYEPEVSAAIRALARPGDVVIDVGANYGWHTLTAAGAVGPGGRVIGVEPNPANAELLRRSASGSGFGNISIVIAAAGAASGTGVLETDGSNGRLLPLATLANIVLRCSWVVPIRPLDEIAAEHGIEAVSLLKIDVEGNEPAVVAGARHLLEVHRPAIISEFFPDALRATGRSEPAEYLRMLRQLGYRISVIGAQGGPDQSDDEIMSALQGTDHVDLLASS